MINLHDADVRVDLRPEDPHPNDITATLTEGIPTTYHLSHFIVPPIETTSLPPFLTPHFDPIYPFPRSTHQVLLGFYKLSFRHTCWKYGQEKE